jgi:hypothetical protein
MARAASPSRGERAASTGPRSPSTGERPGTGPGSPSTGERPGTGPGSPSTGERPGTGPGSPGRAQRAACAGAASSRSRAPATPIGLALLAGALAVACAQARNEEVAPDLDAGGGAGVGSAGGGAVGAGGATNGIDGPGGQSPADGPGASPAEPPFSDPFLAVDGTRIKARWVEAPGNLRIWAGWYDTALGTPCSFERAADGELRCLPAGYTGHFGVSATVWKDAACTIPLWERAADGCPGLPPYIFEFTNVGCRQRQTRVFQRGALSPARPYRRGSLGCRPSLDPSTTSTFHEIGPEVPPTRFVQGRLVARPSPPDAAAPLVPVLVESEDGARRLAHWQDAVSGLPCQFYTDASGGQRCWPGLNFGHYSYYTDATCTRPAALPQGQACDPPVPGVLVALPGCPAKHYPASYGAPLTEVFTTQGDGICRSAPAPDAWALYQLGDPLPETSPVLASVIENATGGRLRRVLEHAGAGRRVVADQLFDTTRQQLCTDMLLADGSRRCVPVDRNPFGFYSEFADPECRQPIARTYGRCPPAVLGFEDRASCPRRSELYVTRGRHAGAVYQGGRLGDPACALSSVVAGPPPSEYWVLAPAPSSDFAELTPIEPR